MLHRLLPAIVLAAAACDTYPTTCTDPPSTTTSPVETSTAESGGPGECIAAESCNATIWDDFCDAVDHQTQGLLTPADAAMVNASCSTPFPHCDVCSLLGDLCVAEGQTPAACEVAEQECNCYGVNFGVPLVGGGGPDVHPRNLPLPEKPDAQEAKASDTLAAGLLAECITGEGRTALLSVEVLAGPNLEDWYPFRFALEGLAHHDMVACLRERVMELQQP